MPAAALSLDLPKDPPEEFRQLYEAEVDYVLSAVARLGARGSDCEELAHDVFVTAFKKFDTFDRARPVRPWLFGIAFKVVWAFRQLSRHAVELQQQPPEVADEGVSAEGRIFDQQTRRDILLALDGLDWNQRAVFIMHDLGGHSAPQIAESLELPLNTVYSRLRLARQAFIPSFKAIRARGGEQ